MATISKETSPKSAPLTSKQLENTGSEKESIGQLKAAPPFQLKSSAGPDSPKNQGKESSSSGMPETLVSGFAASTGHDLSDVKVHYNSSNPAQVGALAYAQGNDIHLGAGQEQHLAHEAAHVVQQREGRVQANASVGGMAVNDSKSLETEADTMGAKALQMKAAPENTGKQLKSKGNAAQLKVMQRKTQDSDFGQFETTKFSDFESRGVDCVLTFNPDETKVDATKIGLSQTIKVISNGSSVAIDPAKEAKRVKSGDGEGYAMDRLSEKNNPIYGAADLAAGDGLENTKQDNNYTTDPTKVATEADGGNATYELGHAYKDKGVQKKKKAGLYDQPKGSKKKGDGKMFETAAIAIEGTQKGKYLGSVKWGYTIGDAGLEPKDIEIASKGDPTVNYTEAAKLWNDGTTRGTLEVTANPATVLDSSNARTTLAKGSKLIQKKTVVWSSDNAVQAELQNGDGTMSGKIYTIKVSDLKDLGDGGATVDVPLPEKK